MPHKPTDAPPQPMDPDEEAWFAWFANAEEVLDEGLESITLPSGDFTPMAPKADADSIDYAHLPPLPPGPTPPFALTPALIERLIALNGFVVTTDRVLFGLRGCRIVGDEPAVGVTRVEVFETRPDHVTLQCTLGVWRRDAGTISVFPGSTVPNVRYLETYIDGGARANQLPTGRYRMVTGRHRTMSGMIRMAEPRFHVLRPKLGLEHHPEGLSLTNRDLLDGPRQVADNIHPAFNPRDGVHGGSAGCQTVQGTYNSKTGAHIGHWATFRREAGVTRDGIAMEYVLLTGLEALLVSDDPTSDALRRLRFGSQGDDVRALQTSLGTGVDGDFGPGTQSALIAWQRANQDGRADGIASPATLAALR